MGARCSSNESLVDYLFEGLPSDFAHLEQAMRLVDRKDFVPEDINAGSSESADGGAHSPYSLQPCPIGDPPWTVLSSPRVSLQCLQLLKVRRNQNILDVGCGPGYMCSIMGFLLEGTGQIHAIDKPKVIQHAEKCSNNLLQKDQVYCYPYTPPKFFVSSCYGIPQCFEGFYDRIHFGFALPISEINQFIIFLRIGGIMVIPLEITHTTTGTKTQYLGRIKRVSAECFSLQLIEKIVFELVDKSYTEAPKNMDQVTNRIPSLRDICRGAIRCAVMLKARNTKKFTVGTSRKPVVPVRRCVKSQQAIHSIYDNPESLNNISTRVDTRMYFQRGIFVLRESDEAYLEKPVFWNDSTDDESDPNHVNPEFNIRSVPRRTNAMHMWSTAFLAKKYMELLNLPVHGCKYLFYQV